jgi:Zn finger protein HypA/HybF involved in hydrogenase expression
VSADALAFAFEVLAPESACPEARLDLSESTALADCDACGTDIPLPAASPLCPRCARTLRAVRGGDDITLVSVTLETNEVTHA